MVHILMAFSFMIVRKRTSRNGTVVVFVRASEQELIHRDGKPVTRVIHGVVTIRKPDTNEQES